jgi:hypothetical protein
LFIKASWVTIGITVDDTVYPNKVFILTNQEQQKKGFSKKDIAEKDRQHF